MHIVSDLMYFYLYSKVRSHALTVQIVFPCSHCLSLIHCQERLQHKCKQGNVNISPEFCESATVSQELLGISGDVTVHTSIWITLRSM